MAKHGDWYRKKYPPSLVEAITTHSLLNTLGYSLIDEVFLELSPRDVIVCLRADGLEAKLRMGEPELELDEMVTRWKALILDWNTGGTISDNEKNQLWRASTAKQRATEVFVRLVLEGFRRKPRSLEIPKALH